MINIKKVLVVASHPDDEILGCGGTLYKLKKKGVKISALFLSDGESSRKNLNIKKLILE
jgi:LmbE family N-acetylglucosaminyl deacetylase